MSVSTGKPIWETPAGDLGTIQEGKFYQLTLSAYDDSTNDASTLYYTMLAGELPDGIQCTATGLIAGVPKAVSSVQGVPLEVGENVTSKFTVRVYTEDENEQPLRVADRTFSLTVSGSDPPVWTTAAGRLGTFIDTTEVSIQLAFTDPDPNQTPTVRLATGALPPGLSLSTSGLISGVCEPQVSLPDDALPGYDLTAFDKFGFDNTTQSSSANYEFTLELTDGRESVLRTFSIFVYSRNDITADTTVFLASEGVITIDTTTDRPPFLLNSSGSIGTYRHDNWFAYQFIGKDFDSNRVEYVLGGDDLSPLALTLDRDSGWLYGYIPDQGLTDVTYNFTVQVQKVDDTSSTIAAQAKSFSIQVVGNLDTDITWSTGDTVGTLHNGEISKLYVEAVPSSGANVEYRIKSGSDSKLPQGLRLLSSGDISGQVSFQSFTLDGGDTTFDTLNVTRLESDPTTFDREFTFTVEAYNDFEQISTFKTFKIIVNYVYKIPFETVYCKAMPENEDRTVLNELLLNSEIFKNEWLYRPTDPYFGKADYVTYQHAFGMKAAKLDDYVDAVLKNHHRKDLVLGAIKVARALDSNDNVLYEVVYSEVEGGLINEAGESVSLAVQLDDQITIDNLEEEDSTFATVYPNSLLNMQTRIIDRVGQFAEILPDWMKSKQEDGSILGFTPAWVIAYTKPGFSKRLQYLIQENFTAKLNKIDFTIDRYSIDKRMTQHWNNDTGKFEVPERITEFDGEAFGDNSTDRTVFDGDSTRFISKVDQYVEDDRLDKYVLYPKHNILGNKDYITNG